MLIQAYDVIMCDINMMWLRIFTAELHMLEKKTTFFCLRVAQKVKIKRCEQLFTIAATYNYIRVTVYVKKTALETEATVTVVFHL